MTALAVAFAALLAGSETWRVEPPRPRVGDRVVATTTFTAAPGEALRLARPCDVDVAFAQVEPVLAAATADGTATLRLEMVAGAAGHFRLGPFALRVGADAGAAAEPARELETAPLEIDVALDGAGDRPPGFGEWRPPLRAASGRDWSRAAWIAGAGLVVAIALGWIARRRRAHAPVAAGEPAVEPFDWKSALARLEAAIPESIDARRGWWLALSDVVRRELARRDPRDSRDRTSEEFAARDGGWAALLAELDDGKFARASRDGEVARRAAADARAKLEARP